MLEHLGDPDERRGTWPAAPPIVVGRDELPAAPELGRTKVLHIITRFAGGAGDNTLRSAVGSDETRYETWIAGAAGGPLWGPARDAGIRTVELPRLREQVAPVDDMVSLWHLVRLIRAERFGVVHTHCSKAGVLGRLAARLAGSPVVVHTFHLFAVHGYVSRWQRSFYRVVERLVRPMADRYLAVSPRVAREAVLTRIAPPGRVSVVPSGVPGVATLSRTDARCELDLPDGVPVVGWVGRMVRQKAPLDFVRMASLVQRDHANAFFVMIGDGGALENASLDRAARDEADRLGARVIFAGFRPDAAQLLSAFDVFVVSSLYEGLGRGLTEALAAGRPVVATAVNGVPDLVEHGSTGLLVQPADPEALAGAVRWMLEHREAADLMGANARERVGSRFGADAMCHDLDRVYSELLGAPKPAGARSGPNGSGNGLTRSRGGPAIEASTGL